jgi:NAD(P)-dependent dehydrogenase (short-subunit alcohol dehydrogenase family)
VGSVEPVYTAIVTGAGAELRIGYDLANRPAAHGSTVAVLDIDEAGVASALSRMNEEYGVLSLGCAVDIRGEKEVDSVARMVEGQLPPVVALANCVGISDSTPLFDKALVGWDRAQRANATGTVLVTQRFMRGIVDRKYCRVVSLSSGASLTPSPALERCSSGQDRRQAVIGHGGYQR